MSAPIDVWIALSSPSSYLACARIDAICAEQGRATRWRPFDIRTALAEEGVKPNVMYPRKGAYARWDWARTARRHDIAFRMPDPFGRSSLPAARLAYWAEAQGGHDALKAVAWPVMEGYFIRNSAIDDPDVLADIAVAAGFDHAEALAALDAPSTEAALHAATDEAVDQGIWGAPTIVVDSEPFWGADRVDEVGLWLERGGW